MLHKKLLAARKKNDYMIEYKRYKEKKDEEQEKNAKEEIRKNEKVAYYNFASIL